MDLQQSPEFQELNVQLVSLAPDPVPALAGDAVRLGITGTPFLSDEDNRVAEQYGVMRWAMPSGEPGHTFVLIDAQGVVRWIRDYGAPENGGLMYVEVDVLSEEVVSRL